MKRLLVLGLTIALTACGEMQSLSRIETNEALRLVSEDLPLPPVVSEDATEASPVVPACTVDYSDYVLNSELVTFELRDKLNVGFGYDLLSGFFKAIGLKLKTEKGTMIMAMDLAESLNPHQPVVDVMGEGNARGVDFRMELDAIQLGVDIGYYWRTPLSKLSEKTLRSGFKNVVKELAPVETDWRSRVVAVTSPRTVIIPAGSVAGVRVGDKFKFFNVRYEWRGAPCESDVFEEKSPQTPVAKGRVVQIEKNAALIELDNSTDEYPPQVGWRVEIEELPREKKERKARVLARSVRIGNVISQPVQVINGQEIDLSIYIRQQITALLNEYGFYERK